MSELNGAEMQLSAQENADSFIEKHIQYKIKGIDGRRHNLFELTIDDFNQVGRIPMLHLVEEVEVFIEARTNVEFDSTSSPSYRSVVLDEFINTYPNIIDIFTATALIKSLSHLRACTIKGTKIFNIDSFNLIGFTQKGNSVIMTRFESQFPISSLFMLVAEASEIK